MLPVAVSLLLRAIGGLPWHGKPVQLQRAAMLLSIPLARKQSGLSGLSLELPWVWNGASLCWLSSL